MKAVWFNSQAERQGSLRQAIVYDYNNKNNEKQAKETVPTWSHNWLLLCNNSISGRPVRGLPGRSGPGPFLPTGLKHSVISLSITSAITPSFF